MECKVTEDNITEVLKYLPYFEAKYKKFYTKDTRNVLDPYIYADEVNAFVKTLYGEGFILNFPWHEWQDEAQKYIKHPNLINSASITIVQKLFTTYVRKERFNAGILAEMIDNGQILALLKRLRVILEKNLY